MFNFSDQAMEEKKVDMRDMIQRVLEKEIIRESLRVVEEVRQELMLLSQPGKIKETTTSITKVDRGNPCAPSLPEVKLKPPSLPFVGGSSEFKSCTSKKMKWRCSICKISATCERGLLEHLAGRKHHAKVASIVIKNPPKSVPSLSEKMEWRCRICEVSPPCKRGLQDHLAGKKHQAKVAALKADNIEKAMKSVEVGSVDLPKKKFEWRCPICKISLTSEIDLQAHLAGKKHKAKVAIIKKGKNI